jgi:hypothetical protein
MDVDRRQVLRGPFLFDFLVQVLDFAFQVFQVTDVLVLLFKLNAFFLHLFLEVFEILDFAFDVSDFGQVLAFVFLLGLFLFDFLLEIFYFLFKVFHLLEIFVISLGNFSPGVLNVFGLGV